MVPLPLSTEVRSSRFTWTSVENESLFQETERGGCGLTMLSNLDAEPRYLLSPLATPDGWNFGRSDDSKQCSFIPSTLLVCAFRKDWRGYMDMNADILLFEHDLVSRHLLYPHQLSNSTQQ